MAGGLAGVEGVRELYALDPSDFTKARNDLAKRLKKDGNGDAAAAVKKLSRPTVVAGALNRVAREHPEDVDELLRLGQRVREAQTEMLSGGDPAQLREATSERRQLVRRLAAVAADIAGEQHRAEAAGALEAASVEPASGEALRAGMLARTPEPTAGFGLAGAPEPSSNTDRRRSDRRELRRLEREAQSTEAAMEKTEERLRRAEDRLAEAQQDVDEARKAYEEAEAAHDEAVAELAAARGAT